MGKKKHPPISAMSQKGNLRMPVKFNLGYQRVGKQPLPTVRIDFQWRIHTSLLLLKSHLVPVNLHTVTELHPQLGLLLGGHGLPALLNAGQSGVRDGVIGDSAGLQSVQRGQWAGTDGGRAARSSASDGAKKHCAAGGRWDHHVENESIESAEGSPGPEESGSEGDSAEEESGGGGEGDGEELKLFSWFEVESREVPD